MDTEINEANKIVLLYSFDIESSIRHHQTVIGKFKIF